jgi:hypothetical protein
VENGQAKLDRLSVISSLADALDVTVGDLLGEPSVMRWTGGVAERPVGQLRDALMDYPALTSALSDVSEPVDATELRGQVEGAWSAYQASKFGMATTLLPHLLRDARAATVAGNAAARREAQRMLALGYHAAAATLGKVGESELAWIASDRGLAAAEASEDPAVIASLLRSVAHSMLSTGRASQAADIVSRAGYRLTQGEQPDDPTWWSLLGSLYLTGAMAAARADAPGEARQFLARARQAGRPARARRQLGLNGVRPDQRGGPQRLGGP